MYDVVIEQVVAALDADPLQAEAVPTVTASDATMVYGRSAPITVTVAADGVTPTGSVEILSGDLVLAEGDLTADGTVRVTIPARTLVPRAASYDLVVDYSGDEDVAPGSGIAEVTVHRTPVTLLTTVTPTRPAVGETRVKVIVEVVNAYGVPRSGTVKAWSRDAGSRSGTIQGGRVTLRLPVFTSTGRKTVVIRYGGSRLLAPARHGKAVRVVR